MAASVGIRKAPFRKADDVPTREDITTLIHAAEAGWCEEQGGESCRGARSSHGGGVFTGAIFHPSSTRISEAVFSRLFARLELLVLAADPVTVHNVFLCIATEEQQQQQNHPRGTEGRHAHLTSDGIHLRTVCSWLPTLRGLDVRTAGVPAGTVIDAADLAKLNDALPTGRTAADKSRRDKLFSDFDPNGNGFLSLAEIDKALRDAVKLPFLFECKPVIIRAFQAARKAVPPSAANHNGDFVSKRTFRLLLWYLKQYFNVWKIFSECDESGDRRVSEDEFSTAITKLVELGIVSPLESKDPHGLFREVDADGGGMILFEEFANWVLSRNIARMEDDDGVDDEGSKK